MRLITLVVAIVALAFAAPALSGKGGVPNGGNGNGNGNASGHENGGGGSSRYTGTLTATPNPVQLFAYFTVSGCGYDTALGNVIVAFTGGSWGSPLDENGCFSIPYIPASVAEPGTYPVLARQYVNNKWTVTGETTVTVVS